MRYMQFLIIIIHYMYIHAGGQTCETADLLHLIALASIIIATIIVCESSKFEPCIS